MSPNKTLETLLAELDMLVYEQIMARCVSDKLTRETLAQTVLIAIRLSEWYAEQETFVQAALDESPVWPDLVGHWKESALAYLVAPITRHVDYQRITGRIKQILEEEEISEHETLDNPTTS